MLQKVGRKLIFTFLFLLIVKYNIVFAAPYNMCTGKEFNDRVKMFLSGGDSNMTKNFTITIFERGYNPPDDKAYYVDISEDNDGTVIAYAKDNILYYYSDSDVVINENTAYMFDKFIRMRNIDLSDMVYFGFKDTRYMFASCHHLHSIKFKKTNKKNENVKKFELSEMQGMFFDCQSLTSIDLSRFDTSRVNNMDEVFYKCYNLKNIYVDKSSWKIENIYSCKNMFSLCHMLKTNLGRKAVDISADDYEKYAIVGTGKDVVISKDVREGFLKDVNTEYADYGERDGTAPIDGDDYSIDNTAPITVFADEPEGDAENGNGGAGGNGVGTSPFVGDKSTGYYAEKEQQAAEQIIVPTTGVSPVNNNEQQIVQQSEQQNTNQNVQETIKQDIQEIESINESQVNKNEFIVIESSRMEIEKNTIVEQEIINNTINENAEIVESKETSESIIENNIVENEGSIVNSENITNDNQPKIMELDEYFKSHGMEGNGDGNGGQEEVNYKFLLMALIISIIVVFLLVGAVGFLVKDKKGKNDW